MEFCSNKGIGGFIKINFFVEFMLSIRRQVTEIYIFVSLIRKLHAKSLNAVFKSTAKVISIK